MPECHYCDSSELAYELGTGRGWVERCIPCLCVERAQPGVHWELFDEYSDELQQSTLRDANDYLRVLARYRQDDPLIKRDPGAPMTVSDEARAFLTNVMGADAHKRPSALIGSGDE
jgi:hypothetical protein